jgi:predicted AAA+ superfamily ATPase
MQYKRFLEQKIEDALKEFPAVMLQGARQTGKTTLVKALSAKWNVQYFNLDDEMAKQVFILEAGKLFHSLPNPVIFDEIQTEPQLLRTIKTAIDENRKSGMFLLTGSSNILLLPKVADSLAGRMTTLALQPLSRGEIEGNSTNFIDDIFHNPYLESGKRLPGASYLEYCFYGGFPEVIKRSDWVKRKNWLRAYLEAIVQKDIRDIANIHSKYDIYSLLQMLAARTIRLLDITSISKETGIPATTTDRYLKHLQALFLFHPLPAWTINIDKQVSKSPKVQMVDPAVVAHLINAVPDRLRINPLHYGMLLENFVYTELKRQATWSNLSVRFSYFRTTNKREVDIVISDESNNIVGIEVKAGVSVSPRDYSGLRVLAEENRNKFLAGIVAYTGDRIYPLGEKLWAMPINRLWIK